MHSKDEERREDQRMARRVYQKEDLRADPRVHPNSEEMAEEDVLKIEEQRMLLMVEEEVLSLVGVHYGEWVLLRGVDVQMTFDSFHVIDLQNVE